MQIVIDVLEGDYERVVHGRIPVARMRNAIRNGIALPKGHGKLGDLDKIKKEMQDYYDDCAKTSEYTRLGFETAIAVVEDAHTIIEADMAESEKE